MKKKITQWESQIDGEKYEFSHQKVKGRHLLTVNGNLIEIRGSFMSTLLGFDEKFTLDSKEARLVIERNVPDVVVGGIYLQSGKKYIPRPAWVLVFAVMCLLVPVISLGGLIPAVLGFGGTAVCVSVSKTDLPSIAKVIICVIITLAAWLLVFASAIFANILL